MKNELLNPSYKSCFQGAIIGVPNRMLKLLNEKMRRIWQIAQKICKQCFFCLALAPQQFINQILKQIYACLSSTLTILRTSKQHYKWVSPTVLSRCSSYIFSFYNIFTAQDDIKKSPARKYVAIFAAAPNRKYLHSAKGGCQNQIPWQKLFALLATAHVRKSGSERLESTQRARRQLSWAETRARRLRQFVFCAFTCHPNGGISRIQHFYREQTKKVFIFISSSSSAAERHQASAAESHHGGDLQFVLSVFFALCAKNASHHIIFSFFPVIKRLQSCMHYVIPVGTELCQVNLTLFSPRRNLSRRLLVLKCRWPAKRIIKLY